MSWICYKNPMCYITHDIVLVHNNQATVKACSVEV